MTGLMLILAGMCVALWPLTHPWGSFAGADVGRTGQWMVAHTFHFLAASFGLLGLLGFVERERREAGALELIGFVIAFIGTILFAGTGMFTAFLWPTLAETAPHLTELDGPFFKPPHPAILATVVSYSLGHILFAIGLARARVLSTWGATALIAGAVMLLIPPTPLSPLPWIVFPAGGVVFGMGLAALGLALRTGRTSRRYAPA